MSGTAIFCTTFVVVLILNQMGYGLCFRLDCLFAALPRVTVITVAVWAYLMFVRAKEETQSVKDDMVLERDRAKAEIEALQQDKDQLASELEQAYQSNTKLKSSLDSQVKVYDELDALCGELVTSLEVVEAQKEASIAQNKRLTKELALSDDMNVQLEAKVEGMREARVKDLQEVLHLEAYITRTADKATVPELEYED